MGFKDVIASYIANSSLTEELFDTTVTFQVNRTYANVTGLTDLDARKIAVGRAASTDNERWALSVGATHIFQLKGYYPAVSKPMRIVNDEEFFEIGAIRHPGELQTIVACWATNARA